MSDKPNFEVFWSETDQTYVARVQRDMIGAEAINDCPMCAFESLMQVWGVRTLVSPGQTCDHFGLGESND